ncbi:MAG: hypothetical protein GTO18_19175 [Anaerolineales bacterium]|nr:hypothetical protein [Anaerolineales bacterium]
MNNMLDLSTVELETNSELWKTREVNGEWLLEMVGNKEIDHLGGKVVLIEGSRGDYVVSVEMKFLDHHLQEGSGGWFGFVIRAQDTLNYELVWFMPNAEKGRAVAYLPVAHGIVPWWTEAYASQQRGGPKIPSHEWFSTKAEVIGDEVSIFIGDEHIFTKKLTYYLTEGRPGFYVGTATDAAFRRVYVEDHRT